MYSCGIDDGDDTGKHSRWMASGTKQLRELIPVLAAFALARCAATHPMMPTPEQIEQARRLGLLDLIQVRGTTDLFGHSYFTSNPSVSADLIAMLRYGLRPNEPGRPLEEIERPFWRVPTEPGAGTAK